ncbi:MAG: choice-of-anchor tandem repeat GloVer-containing protein, partial [Capsulimonadaceae bacterium]
MHTNTTLSSPELPGRLSAQAFDMRALRALAPAVAAVTLLLLIFSRASAQIPAAHATSVGALASATRVGAIAASQAVNLSLVLPLRNQDQLQTLLRRLYDPGDPLFHHFLTPQEFTAQFGPTHDRVDAVETVALAEGFRVLDVSPNNTIIHVQAPASTVSADFHVTLSDYVGPDNVHFMAPDTAPTIPKALSENQVSVVGLDGSKRPHHFSRVVGGLTPVKSGSEPGGPVPSPKSLQYYSGTGLLPSDVYKIYNWSMPSSGTGQNVALFELDGWTSADISDWESNALLGASSLVPTVVSVDGGSQEPQSYTDSIETTLDIDMVLTMAPGMSSLYVYEAPNYSFTYSPAQETLDIFTRMATDDTAQVISTSWGFSEDDWIPHGEQFAIDESQIFEQLAVQGQTVCVASGDTGAYNNDFSTIPDVGLEAAMPYVLSVGGTDLTDGPGEAYISETSWADPSDTSRGPDGAGGGGGISSYWPIPTYQVGAFEPATNPQGSLTDRNLPDVSLFADYDDNGYEIIWTDTYGYYGTPGNQYVIDVNGTSASAPLWGGFLADVNSGRASAGELGLGFADPAIYTLAEEPEAYSNDFHDINDGSNNLFFTAVTGYDNSTGWGSFQGDNIYSDLLTYDSGSPHTPTGLSAGSADAEVSLSWNACTWATSYNIYRGTTSGGEGSTAIATVAGTTYANTGLTNGVTYYYVVTSVNSSGQSGRSAEVSATPESTLPPGSPTGLAAIAGVAQVSLSWTASATATGYNVYRGTTAGVAGSEIADNTASTNYLDTGLTNGVRYYYYVTAINSNGASTRSNTASATPEPLPTAPTNFAATTSSGAMLLSWTGDSHSTTFSVYEGTAAGGESTTPVATTANSYILITGLTNHETYYFKVAGVDSVGTGPASSESSNEPMLETILHTFDFDTEGIEPVGLLQASNGDFYGMTLIGEYGGPASLGTQFELDPAGQLSILDLNTNGVQPAGNFVYGNDGCLYGMYTNGGSTLGTGLNGSGDGKIFRVTPTGVETTLHNFLDGSVPNDGWAPMGPLLLARDGNFYGVTVHGGSTTAIDPNGWGYGTVFRMSPSGTVTILHNFGDGSVPNDGTWPYAALIQASDGKLYGTTAYGGKADLGTVFSITTAGVETVLHQFDDGTTPNDGEQPLAPLLQASDGNFYGTTCSGGSAKEGTVFRVDASGDLTILHNFADGTVAFDGRVPIEGLIQATDGNFYGAAQYLGFNGAGTVYRMDSSGHVAILHAFNDGSVPDDGAYPFYTVIQGLDGGIYGVTDIMWNGDGTGSTVYRIDAGLAPPPSPPTPNSLTATSGDAEVSLSWDTSIGATSYNIYRATTTGGEGTTAYVVGVTTSTYVDKSVANGTTYYYKVAAVNAARTSPQSNEASAMPQLPAPAPTGLTATAGNAQVSLSWTSTVGATSYNIYRATVSGAEGSTDCQSGITTTTYTDTGLTNGTTYFYTVAAVNVGGVSPQSKEASATPELPIPTAPTNLAATAQPDAVALTWSASPVATSYGIYLGTASGGEGTAATMTVGGPAATVTNLSPGTTYYFTVIAFNSAGKSGPSNEASATPLESTTYDVFTWGYNGSGNFGDGTTTSSSLPVEVSFTGVTAIACNNGDSVFLRSDGTVWASGYNYYGQLGNGTTTSSSVPVQVSGLTGVVSIAGGGGSNGLALRSDGTVWSWGDNSDGQLGNGTTTSSLVPVQVSGLAGVTSIAMGGNFCLVLRSDGTVWAWGWNNYGELGNGTTTQSDVPVQVPGLTGVTTIACGGGQSLILKSDGTLWTWGMNLYGELGIGSTVNSLVPVQVTALTGVIAVAGGGNSLSMALRSDGSVWTWGNNQYGKLGNGTTTDSSVPVEVTGLTGAIAITAGADNAMAIRSDGSAWAWGNNYWGELGNGTTTNSSVPVQVTGLVGTTAIAGGDDYALALVMEPLSTPTGLTAVGANNSVSLSWNAVTGATSYSIYRATTTGAEGSSAVALATTTSYTDTGLTNGVKYFYKVAAVNSSGTSTQSTEASATPEPAVPAAPTGLAATAGNTQVSLSWTASLEATAYTVYRATTSGAEGSTPISSATSTSYTNTGLTNGVTYFYKVAAVNGSGTSTQSTEASATPKPPIPAVPTGLAATAGNTQVSLSWTASLGATSYNVYRGTSSGAEGTTAIGTSTTTSFTNIGLTNGVEYYYKVAAVNAGGTSAQSFEASATPEPPIPPAPTALVATAGNAQVSLVWPGSTGATSYSVYRATTSGAEGTTAIGTSTTTSFTNTGLTNGVEYYYKVAAVDAGGTSAQSSEASATPDPAVPASPTGLTAAGGMAQVSLSWTAGTGATSYNVYRATSSGAEGTSPIGTTTTTTYTDTGLTNGVAYYYQVAGLNSGGTSAKSNEASATPGPPVSNITHVLWSNPNGSLSLWTYNPSTGAFTTNTYGPYPGWSPRAIADGPDGQTRVLWVTSSGTIAIWTVNDTTGTYTQNTFGPYPGWSATALSVGTNDVTHVLCTSNGGGSASVWNYTGTSTYTQNTFGTYAGWTASAIADGPDGMTRVMWVSSAGAVSFWNLNSATGAFTAFTFGPYAGWTAAGLS